MKTFITLYSAAALVLSVASGQNESETEVKRFSESLIKQFESLPDKDAFDLWRKSRDPIIAGLGMMESAVRNERIDFLKRVFREQGDFFYLIRAVNELPLSNKRDEMVIMMLRSESPFWHSEEVEIYQDGSRGATLDNAIEPFIGVIGRRLPALSIDENLFATKASRLKLAEDLESAMGKASSAPQAERPEKRLEPRETPPPPTSVEHESSESKTEAKRFTPPKSGQTWIEQLKWGAIFLVLVSLYWMLFKKRKIS